MLAVEYYLGQLDVTKVVVHTGREGVDLKVHMPSVSLDSGGELQKQVPLRLVYLGPRIHIPVYRQLAIELPDGSGIKEMDMHPVNQSL